MKLFDNLTIWLKEQKGKKENWLLLLLAGILLLVIAIPTESPESSKSEESGNIQNTGNTSGSWSEDTYVSALEKRLEHALEQIQGVGKVSVMITLSSSSEKIVEKELETRVSESTGSENETNQSNDSSEQVVYSNETGEEVPYVKQEISPTVQGVLVVAEGGDNAVVVENITEVVQALFNVDTHKIRVMKHN